MTEQIILPIIDIMEGTVPLYVLVKQKIHWYEDLLNDPYPYLSEEDFSLQKLLQNHPLNYVDNALSSSENETYQKKRFYSGDLPYRYYYYKDQNAITVSLYPDETKEKIVKEVSKVPNLIFFDDDDEEFRDEVSWYVFYHLKFQMVESLESFYPNIHRWIYSTHEIGKSTTTKDATQTITRTILKYLTNYEVKICDATFYKPFSILYYGPSIYVANIVYDYFLNLAKAIHMESFYISLKMMPEDQLIKGHSNRTTDYDGCSDDYVEAVDFVLKGDEIIESSEYIRCVSHVFDSQCKCPLREYYQTRNQNYGKKELLL